MSESSSLIPKSRKGHLFKMAARVAMKQGEKFLSADHSKKLQVLIDQADIVVNHVGRLKGAAMKAVQTLSVEGYDFLPPEVITVLEKLQSQAPPVDPEIMHQQIRQELGEERFLLLKDLSTTPLAAASIGQVFTATYQGESVVVKVQYPGIAESVDEDIDTLKSILKTFVFLANKKVDIEDLMEEARRVLKLETDYIHEIESLNKYRENFKNSVYIVPKAYPEMTTHKVIVLSHEPGKEFSKWLKTKPSHKDKQQVAEQLLKLYIKEFFENKLVQTDPNPANFLINDKNQLILLDFGATVYFDNDFVKFYQRLLRAVFAQDKTEIEKQVFELKFLSDKESQQTRDLFIDFLIYSLSPFDPDDQPFDFSDSTYSTEVRRRALLVTRALKFSAPPKQLIFLHRKLGGIFMLLKQLDAKADLMFFRNLVIENDYGADQT